MRTALGLALLLTALTPPAFAQDATAPAAASEPDTSTVAIVENYRRRMVTVYGNDPCPAASSIDEIVVCARRPEEERFRLRQLDVPDGVPVEQGARIVEQGGTARTLGTDDVRIAGGTGTCTPIGPGGLTGCNKGVNLLAIGEALNSLVTDE
ncbi:hypothetical protein ACFOMD_06075 [Sphingoaurantiacus capsulatus]|uniref:Uncharacterized protein n=1 Tax=Sphingoaurantiacus capsulatus TaxID=1771310 RepID=A0ABV7X7N1_9SPHN